MPQNKERSTYVIDQETEKALRGLVNVWGVSKSEALRRSIRIVWANQQENARPSPAEVLLALSKNTKGSQTLEAVAANQYLQELAEEHAAHEELLAKSYSKK
jgi:hypothetical protein